MASKRVPLPIGTKVVLLGLDNVGKSLGLKSYRWD